MSRFGDCDGDENGVPWEFWQANAMRALGGKPGQQALRDLEAALVALPEKRLISGALAHRGEVCTVGALVAHRRMTAGEERAAILEQLEALAPPHCECGHRGDEHEGGKGHCGRSYFSGAPCACEAFVYNPDESEDYGLVTADAGRAIGLTFTLAWELAYTNDERFGSSTPEQRYEQVLAWVRAAILPTCDCGGPTVNANVDGNGGHNPWCPANPKSVAA